MAFTGKKQVVLFEAEPVDYDLLLLREAEVHCSQTPDEAGTKR